MTENKIIDKQRLIEKANKYEVDIRNIADALCLYAELLVDYNKKVNLTAITDAQGIEDKHFIDSLLFANSSLVNGDLVDVGTGAGFPGIVAKLYKPNLNVTLLEPTGKRVAFLQYVCEQLGITSGIFFVKERAEEAARKQYREKFDVATARAVANLNVLCEYCLPLVKKGGVFIAMKGTAGLEEMQNANGAAIKLGGKFDNFTQDSMVTLPNNDNRMLIVCKKISQTANIYPRNGGKIAKSPLL